MPSRKPGRGSGSTTRAGGRRRRGEGEHSGGWPGLRRQGGRLGSDRRPVPQAGGGSRRRLGRRAPDRGGDGEGGGGEAGVAVGGAGPPARASSSGRPASAWRATGASSSPERGADRRGAGDRGPQGGPAPEPGGHGVERHGQLARVWGRRGPGRPRGRPAARPGDHEEDERSGRTTDSARARTRAAPSRPQQPVGVVDAGGVQGRGDPVRDRGGARRWPPRPRRARVRSPCHQRRASTQPTAARTTPPAASTPGPGLTTSRPRPGRRPERRRGPVGASGSSTTGSTVGTRRGPAGGRSTWTSRSTAPASWSRTARERQVDAGGEGHGLEPAQGLHRAVGVARGQRAVVARCSWPGACRGPRRPGPHRRRCDRVACAARCGPARGW